MRISELLNTIKSYGNSEISEPIDERDTVIPKPYMELLKMFNGGEIFVPGTVIYGIGMESKFPLFEAANTQATLDIYEISNSYLVVGHVNYGDLICIDKEKPHHLYLWDTENHSVSYEWDSFEKLLEEEIEDYILYLEGGDHE